MLFHIPDRQCGREAHPIEFNDLERRKRQICADQQERVFAPLGIRLRRDNWVSVRYAEELHSTTSSVTLQKTDRQEILGQKSSHCQRFL